MNMKNFLSKVLLLCLLTIPFTACDENNNFVLMSLEEEKNLGKQVSEEIESNTDEFKILSEADYPEAYGHMNRIVDDILNSGNVQYKSEFAWDVHIIHNDSVMNAFATPGGYIYVYTGLIKFLEKEDDLAGVMGHEIAHADLRHSARQIQRMYGIQILSDIIFGEESSQLEDIAMQVAGTLAGLKFSREFETEADNNSVLYLSETDYQCNGAAAFFQKLIDNDQTPGIPQFLSTHPSPDNRVENINNEATTLGCETSPLDPDSYEAFKQSLP